MEELKYEDVFSQLEALVASIEDPQRDLSLIGDDVRKAMDLIKWCKDYINGNQQKLEALMKED